MVTENNWYYMIIKIGIFKWRSKVWATIAFLFMALKPISKIIYKMDSSEPNLYNKDTPNTRKGNYHAIGGFGWI